MSEDFPDNAFLVLAERFRQQGARECAPRELRIGAQAQHVGTWIELFERRAESAPSRGLVEVGRQLDDRRILQVRLTAEATACGEDQQRAADGRVSFLLGDRDALTRQIRRDYESDVVSFGQSPSQQPSFSRQRGHCHVPWRHSICAAQRRQSSTIVRATG